MQFEVILDYLVWLEERNFTLIDTAKNKQYWLLYVAYKEGNFKAYTLEELIDYFKEVNNITATLEDVKFYALNDNFSWDKKLNKWIKFL